MLLPLPSPNTSLDFPPPPSVHSDFRYYANYCDYYNQVPVSNQNQMHSSFSSGYGLPLNCSSGGESQVSKKQKSDQESFGIHLDQVKSLQDRRTCICIKNIPVHITQAVMLREIGKHHQGRYDFFYIPIDFQSRGNKAYCFINFLHPLFILDFFQDFQNKNWLKQKSKKKVELYYGNYSNIKELKDHFCHSNIIKEVDENMKPRIFKVKEIALVEQSLKRVIKKQGLDCSVKQALEWFPISSDVLF